MQRLVMVFALGVLQACSNSAQDAQASSVEGTNLGTFLNQEYAVPLQSKPITSAPVSRQHHGEDWPFIVDSGVIGCEDRLYPYFRAKGHTYKLTEMTKPEYESIAPIWRDNPNKAVTKYSLLVVIDAALGFCDLS